MQDNHARPYTNGTVIHSGPVQIVASEYREPSKEKSPETQKEIPEPKEASPELSPEPEIVETEIVAEKEIPEPKEASPEPSPEPKAVEKEISPEKELAPAGITPDTETTPEEKEKENNVEEEIEDNLEEEIDQVEEEETLEKDLTEELIKLTQKIEQKTDTLAKLTGTVSFNLKNPTDMGVPCKKNKLIRTKAFTSEFRYIFKYFINFLTKIKVLDLNLNLTYNIGFIMLYSFAKRVNINNMLLE